MTALNTIAKHEQNRDVAERLIQALAARNLNIRHNTTSVNSRDGYHRYVVLDPDIETADYSIRSRACVDYAQARYSRNFQPSIIGERRALEELLSRYAD